MLNFSNVQKLGLKLAQYIKINTNTYDVINDGPRLVQIAKHERKH